jgi:hypothetical protein
MGLLDAFYILADTVPANTVIPSQLRLLFALDEVLVGDLPGIGGQLRASGCGVELFWGHGAWFSYSVSKCFATNPAPTISSNTSKRALAPVS